MLTENEARDLLHLAGATIDVPSAEPIALVAKPRSRWPMLAAAAAVVAVVATSVALAQRTGDPKPVGPTVTIPRVDYAANTVTLEADQIPSIFGYDEASARALLEGLGLSVSVEPDHASCDNPGHATRTVPALGATYEPGDSVSLGVSTSDPNGFCIVDREDLAFAWQLLAFANGRGPAPDFANNVVVVANSDRSSISGLDAAQLDNWVDGTPLGVLRERSREVRGLPENDFGARYSTPSLGVEPSNPRVPCDGYDLSGLPTGHGIQLWLKFRYNGPNMICTTLDVVRSDGQITAVVLRTNSLATEPGDTRVAVPNVVGKQIDKAEVVLRAERLQGVYVQKGAPPPLDCRSPEVVATQDPLGGTLVPLDSSVTLTLRWLSCSVQHGPGPGALPH